jgi:hypothetical protein
MSDPEKKIVPDGENMALTFAYGVVPNARGSAIMKLETITEVNAGILSLVAERDALNVEVERLRKVVGNLWKVIPAGTAEALRNPTHPYADVWAQQYSLELPLPNPEPE